ncbi:NAD binding domain of 6-phosphogluconate dehydrogenase [Colletotrichum tofieldiae]|uniref:NAD binding domain of 6-phosphogluconate dehydrogenase n=1 Tax=Colletotrichum tofieldiae TaxID=708197 RepID=A0A161W2Y9_9PEZI|nr:NAD binding domain of 6-phosphogluconate dehydrogenase [Colletotrichum tofieldiae]
MSSVLVSAASPHMKLGWIGLGSMGMGMASNLQKHLSQMGAPSLNFYNRTKSRGAALETLGGVSNSVDELAKKSDVIFMSLSDGNAVETVLNTMLVSNDSASHLNKKVVVDTSSVHPDTSARARLRLKEKGAEYIAAPVLGSSPIAAKGQLLWILAGAEAAIDVVSPYIVGVMGRGVIRLGNDVRLASSLKAVANSLGISMIEVIAEAHVFAEKAGLGIADVENLIQQQIGPAGLLISQRLTTGAYMPPRGERPWADAGLAVLGGKEVQATAADCGVQLSVSSLVMRNVEEAKAYGDSIERQLDVSALYGILRMKAGLSFETDYVKQRDGSC